MKKKKKKKKKKTVKIVTFRLVHSGLYTSINVANVALTSQLRAHVRCNDALFQHHTYKGWVEFMVTTTSIIPNFVKSQCIVTEVRRAGDKPRRSHMSTLSRNYNARWQM
jgi:phosphoenolpyruvate synthase/pyruvate phosphate dikinase